MEIVKRGKIPEEKEAEWTCKKCSSVIRAKRSEGRFHDDCRNESAIIFACPVCGEENWIDAGKFKQS
jgi:predicted RNA-binding Zn-ribbon protein involved in translation (DUF1610 family)